METMRHWVLFDTLKPEQMDRLHLVIAAKTPTPETKAGAGTKKELLEIR